MILDHLQGREAADVFESVTVRAPLWWRAVISLFRLLMRCCR